MGEDSDFWETLSKGSIDALTVRLSGNLELANHRDPSGRLPLHVAAELGDLARVEALLRAGGLLNAVTKDFRRETPLHSAVRSQAEDVRSLCARMITLGSELNARDSEGRTPLHLAVFRGDPELVGLFVDEGADPLLKDGQGRTTLELARELESESLLPILRSAVGRSS